MKNPSLLPLVVVALLAVSLPPIAAVPLRITAVGTQSYVDCVGNGVYAANSTFEANRRRLAGLLAEAAAHGSYYTDRAVGYWPNRQQAFLSCHRRRSVNGSTGYSSCAACIAGAFLKLERACPYHRETFFSSRNCSLQLSEFRVFGSGGIFEFYHSADRNILKQVLASGLIFQAIGFGWLFFLLLQEWRSRKRGTLRHSTPLLSGD